MLGHMIALHHRMTQNAADMMQLIQETLNQADEAHSRRHHDGQGCLQQQYAHSRSLAESSRPHALAPAGVDEINPPGPLMLNPVNPATPTDPPPHVGFQSLQSHRRSVVVNPKSLSYCTIAGDTNDSIDLRSKSPMVSRASRRPIFPGQGWDRSTQNKTEAMPRYILREDELPGTSSTSSTLHSSSSSGLSLRWPVLLSRTSCSCSLRCRQPRNSPGSTSCLDRRR